MQFHLCPDKGAAEQVVVSGILPILALSLWHRGPLTRLTARLVSELARECKSSWPVRLFTQSHYYILILLCVCGASAVVRKGFGDAGLVGALLSVLTSSDEELLLHTARAVSRLSYESSE